MADTEVLLKELCNYCKRKTSKKVIKCKKCDKIFHNSCATRVLCCDLKLTEQRTDSEDEKDVPSLAPSNEELLAENQELKQKNQELNQQITQLKCNITKYQNENHQLKGELQETRHMDKNNINALISTEIEKRLSVFTKDLNSLKLQISKLELITKSDKTKQHSKWEQKMSTDKTTETKNPQYNPATKNSKPGTPNQSAKQTLYELQDKQLKIMDRIINLDTSSSRNIELNLNTKQGDQLGNKNQHKLLNLTPEGPNKSHEFNNIEENNLQDGFKEVTRKRRRQQGKVGTREVTVSENPDETPNFEGSGNMETKKFWVFIKKVKDSATSEKISKYLEMLLKAEATDVSVKKLETYYQMKDNNCYLVGIDSKYKNKIYDPTLWPKGVVFDRFNFRKGEKFLGNSKPKEHKIPQCQRQPIPEDFCTP